MPDQSRVYDGDPETLQSIINGQAKIIDDLQHHINKLNFQISQHQEDHLRYRAEGARMRLTIAELEHRIAEDEYERHREKPSNMEEALEKETSSTVSAFGARRL